MTVATTRMMLLTMGTLSLLGCPPAPASQATEDPVAASPDTLPSTTTTTTTTATPSPSPTPSPSVAPSTVATSLPLPLLERTCATDAECIVFEEATTGAYACCMFGNGCVLNVANNTSLMRFRTACKSTPPSMCPPIGCAQPENPKARCDKGTCVLVK